MASPSQHCVILHVTSRLSQLTTNASPSIDHRPPRTARTVTQDVRPHIEYSSIDYSLLSIAMTISCPSIAEHKSSCRQNANPDYIPSLYIHAYNSDRPLQRHGLPQKFTGRGGGKFLPLPPSHFNQSSLLSFSRVLSVLRPNMMLLTFRSRLKVNSSLV